MKSFAPVAALVFAAASFAPAQIFVLDKDQLTMLTSQNPYPRFADGRPKVPDEILKQFHGLSQEEIWSILPGKGYPNFYEGNWMQLHPGKKLVGRVVTAQYMPLREDLQNAANAKATAMGWDMKANVNQRVIDLLQPGDVLVVDLFGKVEGGTYVGDNLAQAIYSATGNGFIIDGAVRDLEGIEPIPMAAYFRAVHPTPIRGLVLTGYNIPIRIGQTTVFPGDIAFGDREGVAFVPPHLAQAILDRAEETHIHDEWTKAKFQSGRYKSTDLYPTPKDPALKAEYEAYKKAKLKR